MPEMEPAGFSEPRVISGEFRTDGRTFVMTLGAVPLSGVGPTAQAAFEDLMNAKVRAGTLAESLAFIATEQREQHARRSLIRILAATVMGFVLIGALVAGTAALAPRVAVDVANVTIEHLQSWADSLTPDQQRRLRNLLPVQCACPAQDAEVTE